MSIMDSCKHPSEPMIWDREDKLVIALAKNRSYLRSRRKCEGSASQPARAELVKIHAKNGYTFCQICGP